MPDRSRAALPAMAPNSVADKSLSVPPNEPNPVRTPERKTTEGSLRGAMPLKISQITVPLGTTPLFGMITIPSRT